MTRLGSVSSEAKALMEQAEEVGITWRVTKKQHLNGTLPYGLGTVGIPRTFGEPRALKNGQAQIRRAIARVKAHESGFAKPVPVPVPTLGSDDTPTGPPPEPVVSMEGPWMARHGTSGSGGRYYPSQVVTERRWSDGRTDYVCNECGDFVADSPRAVVSHHNRRKDHDQPQPKPVLSVGPAYEPEHRHTPTQARVDAILALLASRPNVGTDLDLRALITEVLAADMERDPLFERGPGLPGQMPSTDAERVAMIRLIIGDEADALREQVQELSSRLVEAEAENHRLVEERQALRELLTDEPAAS